MEEFMKIWFVPFIVGIIASLITTTIAQLSLKGKGGRWIILAVAIFVLFMGVSITYLLRSPIVDVPKVVGMDTDEARREVEKRGLIPKVIKNYDENIPKLQVISQEPAPGVSVNKNTEVKIKVSRGPMPKAPNVIGKSRDEAKNEIKKAGLIPRFREEFGSTISRGKVISQNPPPGTGKEIGSIVEVVISTETAPAPEERVNLQITEPLTEIHSLEETDWISFPVKGTSKRVTSSPKWRIYALVYPLSPFGGGWFVQKPKANINRDGTWFTTAQLGAEGYPVNTGDKLQVVAIATEKISEIERLTKVETLQDLPDHIQSNIVELIVRRTQLPRQSPLSVSIEKTTITHINELPISWSIEISNRHYTAKGIVITSARRDDLRITTYVKPPNKPTIYKQYDEGEVLRWKRRTDGKWEGEWEVGGYIGRPGMDYNMRFKVWAVAVIKGEIGNLKDVYGNITNIHKLAPSAIWSNPVVVIKKP